MRIAVAQTPGSTFDEWQTTLTLLDRLTQEAAERGADLVLFPEGAWPTYYIGSTSQYVRARDAGMPGTDALLDHVKHWAAKYSICIAMGYIAEAGDRLYNAVSIISPDGDILGTHNKCFLWDFDRDFFKPGEDITPIHTSFGQIGAMICADARLPEIPTTLVHKGAQLLVQPTGWVNAGTPDSPWNPQPDFLIPTRAKELGVPIASASKFGVEGNTLFVGSSLICDADGSILAQAPQKGTEVIVADVEPMMPSRPVISDTERAVLMTVSPPSLPSSSVPPLKITLSDDGSVSDARGPVLVISKTHIAGQPRTPGVLVVDQPIRGLRYAENIAIGAISSEEAQRFAPIRALAIQGAHVVVVFGDAATTHALQTRAMENRIFVVEASGDGTRVFAPSGLLSDSPSLLNVAEAAQKCVTAHTNVITGRNPEQYAF